MHVGVYWGHHASPQDEALSFNRSRHKWQLQLPVEREREGRDLLYRSHFSMNSLFNIHNPWHVWDQSADKDHDFPLGMNIFLSLCLSVCRTFWRLSHGRLQAVHVISSVAVITEQQLILHGQHTFLVANNLYFEKASLEIATSTYRHLFKIMAKVILWQFSFLNFALYYFCFCFSVFWITLKYDLGKYWGC